MTDKFKSPINFYWIAVLQQVHDEPWISKSRLYTTASECRIVNMLLDREFLCMDRAHGAKTEVTLTETGERLLEDMKSILARLGLEDRSNEIIARNVKNYDARVSSVYANRKTVRARAPSKSDDDPGPVSLKGMRKEDLEFVENDPPKILRN